MSNHKLIEIEWPEFGGGETLPPAPTANELQKRVDAARAAMESRGLTHLVVYADREHFANIHWLTDFDPRFEEALLILGPRPKPLIVVGNECEAYLPISALWNAGRLEGEVFPSFALPNMIDDGSRPIRDVFAGQQIGPESRIGCVGWKQYGSPYDHDTPSYLVDALRSLASYEHVVNAAGIFSAPDCGLRSFATAAEIARFEYANVAASNGVRRMLSNLREGMTDLDVATSAGYNGLPLGCHWTIKTGAKLIGLAGPQGNVIKRGNRFSGNVCYRGSNCCRSAWLADSAADLPDNAQDYADAFAGPYFAAMAAWFELLTLGRPGRELHELVAARLPYDRYHIWINAGHLIHTDEWMSSPIYAGSESPLHSGMILQSDVIPSSPIYHSSRMEDGYALADAGSQAELERDFPDSAARCRKRRQFMSDVLGIQVPSVVLPLGNVPGMIAPYLFRPTLVFGMKE